MSEDGSYNSAITKRVVRMCSHRGGHAKRVPVQSHNSFLKGLKKSLCDFKECIFVQSENTACCSQHQFTALLFAVTEDLPVEPSPNWISSQLVACPMGECVQGCRVVSVGKVAQGKGTALATDHRVAVVVTCLLKCLVGLFLVSFPYLVRECVESFLPSRAMGKVVGKM